jgi:hypothetical protein
MIKYRKTDHPKWKWELEESYRHNLDGYQFMFFGLDAGDNYIRLSSEYIEMSEYDILTQYINLKQGYAINGVNLLPDRKVWMRGAFVHDALWQLVGLGKLPKEMVSVADRIFRDIIAKDDNKLTAWLMWAGVRIGAKWRFGWRY